MLNFSNSFIHVHQYTDKWFRVNIFSFFKEQNLRMLKLFILLVDLISKFCHFIYNLIHRKVLLSNNAQAVYGTNWELPVLSTLYYKILFMTISYTQ